MQLQAGPVAEGLPGDRCFSGEMQPGGVGSQHVDRDLHFMGRQDQRSGPRSCFVIAEIRQCCERKRSALAQRPQPSTWKPAST